MIASFNCSFSQAFFLLGGGGGGRGVFEICFGEYSQTNGISFGMGLIWLICCSFGQNKLPLRNKTLDRKRSTPNTQTREFAVNTQTRHRRRKRGGGDWGGFSSSHFLL